MVSFQFPIESKQRRARGFLASLEDFSLGESRPIDPAELISNPLLSLYSLDDENRRAVFVELPQDVDLTKAPFVYYTQYEHAQRVVAVPYETFIELGEVLPPVQRPIMIYSTGRSGSTLFSHILNESGEVVSLSEPDVATQFAHLWSGPGGSRDEELRRLAASTARFLFRPYPADDGKAHAIKVRSEGVRAMDLFQSALPDVKNLFSYRDALGWATSFNRLFLRDGMPEVQPVSDILGMAEAIVHADWSYLRAYLDEGQESMSIPEFLTIWWIYSMENYLMQTERGVPALAFRFADLIESPERTLQGVFDYCGLQSSSVQRGMGAFERDSQSGTELSRDNPDEANTLLLTEQQVESVNAILRRHPILNTSDFSLPNTLPV